MIAVCCVAVSIEVVIDWNFEILKFWCFMSCMSDKTWQKMIRSKHMSSKIRYDRKKNLTWSHMLQIVNCEQIKMQSCSCYFFYFIKEKVDWSTKSINQSIKLVIWNQSATSQTYIKNSDEVSKYLHTNKLLNSRLSEQLRFKLIVHKQVAN